MAARPSIVLVLAGALASLGAQYRTQNFLVEAPTPEIAQAAGQWAEHYRREKAMQWLGREMPPWPEPCPLRITVTMNGSGGATSFVFDRGQILEQNMHIEGTVDRLMKSVLPHEVTHTVFAHYFRQPVPRWADEGGSVLSEDDLERGRHDRLVREVLNTGRSIPLRRLFTLTQYPRDVMVLYAEGYSVTNFLVGLSSRPQFLNFIAQGMRGDWDAAVRTYYHYNSVEELEAAWLQHLRNTKQQPPALLASRGAEGDAAHRVMVRQTVPPVQPLTDDPPRPVLGAPEPTYRGQIPGEQEAALNAPSTTRPGYLPDIRPAPAAQPSPAPPPLPPPPPAVRLQAPQFDGGGAPARSPSPGAGSPVGYSR
jgi:hypothetical protein